MTAKLAFSIATIVDPEVLIVDEILSVGDIKFQEKSRAKMMNMINGGTTVLYVSHSLESIEELCTRVIWLEHGKIKMQGDPEDVCAAYYYFQMGETVEEAKKRMKEKKMFSRFLKRLLKRKKTKHQKTTLVKMIKKLRNLSEKLTS